MMPFHLFQAIFHDGIKGCSNAVSLIGTNLSAIFGNGIPSFGIGGNNFFKSLTADLRAVNCKLLKKISNRTPSGFIQNNTYRLWPVAQDERKCFAQLFQRNSCVTRTVSQYFNQIGAKGEQRLVEDLIIESIRINGIEIMYIPRTLVKADPIFGEDPLSKFEKVFPLEMYFDNPSEGWQGDRYLISKFGLEMREQANFIVARRRFNEVVRYDGFNNMPITQLTDKEVRPKEGDLIYMPLTNDLFQIQFADHESVFYQLGYRYIWRIDVQKYDYSHEKINTGVPQIDRVQQFFENVDSTVNDPLAENNELKKKAKEIIDTTEKNVFGDPV
jgi:hypothetical protein